MPAMDNAHALVIGIADYQHITTLPRVKDAHDIATLLTDPQHCGYPGANVQLLVDAQATQTAFRAALARLAQLGTPASTVFIYFSGHGGRIESGPYAGEYLLPVDAEYRSDQSVAHTAISGPEFAEALRAIPAQKVVVVFDCCHAGGIGQPRDVTAPSVRTGLPERFYEVLQAGRGRVILAACRDTEYSYVLNGADYGLFTQHLLEGLRGGVASEDGFIRIFDLFEYLQPRVTATETTQHPIFKADLEVNFAVALYRGGQTGLVRKDAQGFQFDAYISYVDRGNDAAWVWDSLVPRLKQAGLLVAVSGDVEEAGVARVVGVERGIMQAKRTVVVLSDAYLADHMATFENVLAQTLGIQEGSYRLLPVQIAPVDGDKLPARISMLTTLDLVHPQRGEREFGRLVEALQRPLPRH